MGIRKLAEKIRSFDSEDDTSSERSVEGQARSGMALSFHRQPPLCDFWIRWKHSTPPDDIVWVERLEDTPDCQLINPCHGCRTIHEICSSFNIKFSAKFKWPRYPGMIMSRIQQGKLTWALVHKEPVEKDVCFMRVFRVSGIEGVPNPWNLPPDPAPSSTWTQTDLCKVQEWLGECKHDHLKCRISRIYHMLPNEMPTRVLDVGVRDEDPIRLHEPVGSSIRYMCLSYCWGGAKFLKTTRANYDKHKQEIRLDELPQLFQDAVRVTRSLGVRYLWIDALCIIQDDINLTDWKRESVRMASVFQNSYLTISATRAPSPHSSLFAKMETTQVGPVMVRKILHAPPIRMREGMEGTEWASNFPLFRRGWAFQERMLSPRVVHFGPHEIEWDCMKRRACQCIPDTEEDIPASFLWGVGTGLDLTATLLEISSIKQRGTLDRVCARIPFGIPLKPSEFLHMKKTDDRLAIAKVWHTTVTNFSPLELTDKSDRLAAISGMAEAMQRNTSNWQYLAGLWKETLLLDLCWHTSPYSRIDKDDRRQPTWSWAFLDGRAFMPIAEWADIDDAGWKLQWEEYAKVVDASCTLATHSSTGLVLDGCLELRCRLIPFDHSLHQMLRDFTFLDEYGSCCCEAQERLYFVPVGSFTYKKSSRHLGLILERIGEDKSSDMVRLGAVVIPIGKISRTRFDGFRSRSHDEQAATHAFRAFKEATGNEMVKIRIF